MQSDAAAAAPSRFPTLFDFPRCLRGNNSSRLIALAIYTADTVKRYLFTRHVKYFLILGFFTYLIRKITT